MPSESWCSRIGDYTAEKDAQMHDSVETCKAAVAAVVAAAAAAAAAAADPDTGCCRCVNLLESHATGWGATEAEVLRIFRQKNLEARRRQLIRRIRNAVCMVSLVSFWKHVASAPDSECAKRAAKRFKANAQ
jgi:ABC-type histidine transport system ATPase subunit